MTRHSIVTALGTAVLTLGVGLAGVVGARAQDEKGAAGGLDSREKVNELYAKKFRDLESQHIADLAKVASGEEGEKADATYRLLFNLAIARNLYGPAEKAAEEVITKGQVSGDVEALANFINAIAEADKGDYDESLSHLKDFVKTRKADIKAARRVEPEAILAVGEAYFQRLVQSGRYDVAQKLCEFAVSDAVDKSVQDHFADRMARVKLLGKAAPPVAGEDIDGDKVSLADFKDKVVLVEFWATWCPPCGPQMLRLNTLREKYKDKGFEVLGVNVDALREGAADMKAVQSAVRRYLIDHGVSWPNVLNGPGERDFAKAYGVDEIPANFLIGRDGTIIGFELGDTGLDRAIGEAVTGKKVE
jgi:peroxiredoxin